MSDKKAGGGTPPTQAAKPSAPPMQSLTKIAHDGIRVQAGREKPGSTKK